MRKYIIFENNLKITDNMIKSWAPIGSIKRPNGIGYWKIVNEIKKGDIIYYVSNSYLIGKGIALADSSICDFSVMYPGEEKGNPEWNNIGYAVNSFIDEDYTDYNICVTKEIEKRLPLISNDDVKPFEIKKAGSVSAHQGGYCYALSSQLEKIILKILNSYNNEDFEKDEVFTNNGFKYKEIDLERESTYNGTSEISHNKEFKGNFAETKVYQFFDKNSFFVQNVANDKKEKSDLKIKLDNDYCYLEVKNISKQSEPNIFISDNEIRNLCLKKVKLCLYSNGRIYISNQNSINFFWNIKSKIENIRNDVIIKYNGELRVTDINIFISKRIIDNYFILVNDYSNIQLHNLLSE